MINSALIHDMSEDGTIHPDLIKDLKENKNFEYLEPIFFAACKSDNLELVKYCLISTNLSSLEKRNEIMLQTFSAALNNNSINVVSHFVLDMNMPYNAVVEEAINDYEMMRTFINSINVFQNSGSEPIIPVRNMFKVRSINQELNIELPINSPHFSKKNKL